MTNYVNIPKPPVSGREYRLPIFVYAAAAYSDPDEEVVANRVQEHENFCVELSRYCFVFNPLAHSAYIPEWCGTADAGRDGPDYVFDDMKESQDYWIAHGATIAARSDAVIVHVDKDRAFENSKGVQREVKAFREAKEAQGVATHNRAIFIPNDKDAIKGAMNVLKSALGLSDVVLGVGNSLEVLIGSMDANTKRDIVKSRKHAAFMAEWSDLHARAQAEGIILPRREIEADVASNATTEVAAEQCGIYIR